ncbi:MAG: DUF1772 domain-containing protein [Saprospiraceae bacterium]|nr:DUF1772 domain-containing protein [Saprospiraceae bacterium]
MTLNLVRFLNIILAGIMAGAVFVIWIGYNPQGYSSETYIEQQQAAITALNTLMPLLGMLTLVLTIISAVQQKRDRPVLITLFIAAGFMIASGLTTRFGNQPINAIVMTWDKAAAPADWTALRDQWWSFHIVRTITTFCGFALVVWSALRG